MRTITLEEHFISPGFLAGPGERLHRAAARFGAARRRRSVEQLAGGRRQAHRRDGRRRDRHAGAVAQFAGRGASRGGRADRDRARGQRFSRRDGEEAIRSVSPALPSLPVAGARQGRRRTGAAGPPAGLQGRDHQRPQRAAAISTTRSSRRSWSAPRRSMCRSISTRRCRRKPVIDALYGGFSPAVNGDVRAAPPGAGTSKPRSISCA